MFVIFLIKVRSVRWLVWLSRNVHIIDVILLNQRALAAQSVSESTSLSSSALQWASIVSGGSTLGDLSKWACVSAGLEVVLLDHLLASILQDELLSDLVHLIGMSYLT